MLGPGRDVRRGFVNARADTRIPDAPADRQPATAAGQTGRGGPPTRRRANEAQTRDRGTNGPALTGKMMHRAVAPGPGYSAAIAMPGSRQGAARSPPPRRAAPPLFLGFLTSRLLPT